jgi:hypothetical protein
MTPLRNAVLRYGDIEARDRIEVTFLNNPTQMAAAVHPENAADPAKAA